MTLLKFVLICLVLSINDHLRCQGTVEEDYEIYKVSDEFWSNACRTLFEKTVKNLYFQQSYFQRYFSRNSDIYSFENFAARIEDIIQHNIKAKTREVTFRQGINEYSDLSVEDMNDKMNGFVVTLPTAKLVSRADFINVTVPTSTNYTAMGFVTAVRNQGLCGSCWTFSVTGAVEGQYFKKTGVLIKLSEQNLIDCNKDYNNGNFGCNGGNMLIAYNYIRSNNGISKSAVYPYRGRDVYSCAYNPTFSVTSVSAYDLLPAGNETLILLALVSIGPLSCAIDASRPSFQNYASGVYNEPLCTRILNHAVL